MRWVLMMLLVGCDTAATDDDKDSQPDSDVQTDSPAPSDDVGPDAFEPRYLSGSRLDAMAFELEPGIGLFSHWYDASLETGCRFLEATDGVLRCLPKTDSLTVLYTDDACTAKVAVDLSGCLDAPYLTELTAPRACDTPEQWQVSSMTFGTAAPVRTWRLVDGLCGEVAPPSQALDWYAVTGVVDPSAFVAGTASAESDGDGMGVDVIEGKDGSRVVERMRADTWGGACSPRIMNSDGAVRCVASSVAWHEQSDVGWWWADEDCEVTEFAYADEATCDAPGVVLETIFPDDPGPPDFAMSEVGDLHVGPAWEAGGATCTEIAAVDQSWKLYEIGNPIPDTRAPALGTTVARGDTHGITVYTAPSGAHLLPSGLWPLVGPDGPCRIAQHDNGNAFACVPTNTPVALGPELVRFADATCTEPLVGTSATAVEDGDPPYAWLWRQSPRCETQIVYDVITHLWELGTRHTGPVYHDDGGCVQAPDNPNQAYFPATAVPFTSLPQLSYGPG